MLVPVPPRGGVLRNPVHDGVTPQVVPCLFRLDPLMPLNFSALCGEDFGLALLAPLHGAVRVPIRKGILERHFTAPLLDKGAAVVLYGAPFSR